MGRGGKSFFNPNPRLEDYPASKNDPGNPLQEDEYWYFWAVEDRQNGGTIKGRTRRKRSEA